MRAMVITASTRAAAGTYQDTSGPVVGRALTQLGFQVRGPQVVADGEPVALALRDAVAQHFEVIVTTGGTGMSPTDRTPEMTRQVISFEVPGVAEAIRMENFSRVPTSILSRGIAGVAVVQDAHWVYRSFIVNLPGSPGGAEDGMAVLGKVLPHIVQQMQGADHGRGGGFAGGMGGPAPAGPGGGFQGGGGYGGGGFQQQPGGFQGGGGYGPAAPPWSPR